MNPLAGRIPQEGVTYWQAYSRQKENKPNYLSSCKADTYSSESHMFFSKQVQYSSLICK